MPELCCHACRPPRDSTADASLSVAVPLGQAARTWSWASSTCRWRSRWPRGSSTAGRPSRSSGKRQAESWLLLRGPAARACAMSRSERSPHTLLTRRRLRSSLHCTVPPQVGGLAVHFPLGKAGQKQDYSLQERVRDGRTALGGLACSSRPLGCLRVFDLCLLLHRLRSPPPLTVCLLPSPHTTPSSSDRAGRQAAAGRGRRQGRDFGVLPNQRRAAASGGRVTLTC